MNTRKTNIKARNIYTYERFLSNKNGGYEKEIIVIKPGENGVIEADIKILHAEDDREVYYNNKNLRPGRTAEEKVCAINIFQTVNNYYGNTSVINSPSDNVQIVSGSENTVSFSYGKVNQKSALVGLQDFLINTGANVAAGLIQAIMQGLF